MVAKRFFCFLVSMAVVAALLPESALAAVKHRAAATRVAAKPVVKAAKSSAAKKAALPHSRYRVAASVKQAEIPKKLAARAGKRKVVVARAVVPEPEFDRDGLPLLRSAAFMVQDVATGQVVLEKNAAVPQPIASISKLMTAMVVLDAHQSLTEVLDVTDADVDMLKGTSSRLAVGTRLTREELLLLALMASENRAATALSRNYPGGQPAFIEAMNVKAKMMGMNDTRFFDPSGLNKNNVSSARDLATMVANASRYPLIREFSTQLEYAAPLSGGRVHTFHNTNALVRDSDWQIDVQKTGYISESGKCLVMQVWMAHKQLAIVLLDSWGKYTRIGDAVRIRKWIETAASRQRDDSLAALHAGKALMN